MVLEYHGRENAWYSSPVVKSILCRILSVSYGMILWMDILIVPVCGEGRLRGIIINVSIQSRVIFDIDIAAMAKI